MHYTVQMQSYPARKTCWNQRCRMRSLNARLSRQNYKTKSVRVSTIEMTQILPQQQQHNNNNTHTHARARARAHTHIHYTHWRLVIVCVCVCVCVRVNVCIVWTFARSNGRHHAIRTECLETVLKKVHSSVRACTQASKSMTHSGKVLMRLDDGDIDGKKYIVKPVIYNTRDHKYKQAKTNANTRLFTSSSIYIHTLTD